MKFVGPINSARDPQTDENWLKSQKYTATVHEQQQFVPLKCVLEQEKKKNAGNPRRSKRNVYANGYFIYGYFFFFSFLCEQKELSTRWNIHTHPSLLGNPIKSFIYLLKKKFITQFFCFLDNSSLFPIETDQLERNIYGQAPLKLSSQDYGDRRAHV